MLFDLRDPQIVEALQDDDRRRGDRAKQRNIWIGVVTGMITGGALFAWQPTILLEIPLPIPFANPIKIIALMIGLTAATVFGLDRAFPPRLRFPYLSTRPVVVGMGGMKRMKTSTIVAIIAALALVIGTGIGLTIALSDDNSSTKDRWKKANAGTETPVSRKHAEQIGDDDVLVKPSDLRPLASGITVLQAKVDLTGDGVGLLYARGRGAWTACAVHPEADRSVDCHDLSPALRESSVHLVSGRSEVLVAGVTRIGNTPEETEYGVFNASGDQVATTIDGYILADAGSVEPLGDTWVSLEGTAVKQRGDGLWLERKGQAAAPIMRGNAFGQPIVVTSKVGRTAVILFTHNGSLSAIDVTPDGVVPALP